MNKNVYLFIFSTKVQYNLQNLSNILPKINYLYKFSKRKALNIHYFQYLCKNTV